MRRMSAKAILLVYVDALCLIEDHATLYSKGEGVALHPDPAVRTHGRRSFDARRDGCYAGLAAYYSE